MKKKVLGHVISEEIGSSKEEPDTHKVISTGAVLTGGALTVGGVITGSPVFTAIGVTVVVVGGTYYLFGGDR